MAERTDKLNIQVKVEGASINQIKAAIKEVDALKNAAKGGSAEFNKLSAESARLRTALGEMQKQSFSANAKMKESYFSTGEELRRFYREQRLGDRTMREGVQTLQVFGSMLGEGVGGAAGKAAGLFQQAEFAVNGLGIAAAGAKGKVSSFGQGLLSIAKPLTATIALLGAVAYQLDSLAKREKAATAALFESEFTLGKISKQKYYEGLKTQLKELLERSEEIKKKRDFWAAAGFKLIPSLFGISEADIIETKLAANKLREEIKKFEAEGIVLGEIIATGRRVDNVPSVNINRGLPTRMAPKGISAKALGGAIAGSGGVLSPITTTIKDAKDDVTEFERAALSSLSNIRGSIDQNIGQAFAENFGIAHTLFGSFISDMASKLFQFGASEAIRGIFSFIPAVGGFLNKILPFANGGTIYEPVIGRGLRSGSMYSIAERGPEHITPMSGPRGGGGQPVYVTVSPEWKYDRLSFAVKQGDRNLAKRTL
jgi:regulator of replication initiation timing